MGAYIIKDKKLPKLLSTRALLDAQDMMRVHGWELGEVARSYFADWSADELAMVRDDLQKLKAELDGGAKS